MNTPDQDDKIVESPPKSFGAFLKSLLWVSIPCLLLMGGLELAALSYSSKTTRLERDGITANAEVTEVSADLTGILLEPDSSSGRRISNLTVHYRFTTRDGADITGSYNIKSYASGPPVGQKMEVRYLPSDPSVFETGIGHTGSQASALHWIAAITLVLWLAFVIFSIFFRCMPKKLTTREKRLQRMKELKSK